MSTYNLVLSLTDNASIADWVTIATRMLPEGGEIHLRGMVVIEPDTPLSEGVAPARIWREKLYQAAVDHPEVHDDVEVYVDYQPVLRVIDDLATLDADLLLIQWDMATLTAGGLDVVDLFEKVTHDIALLSSPAQDTKGDVLLSLRGGPNITLGTRLALAMAGDASITLFHAADKRRSAPDLELLIRAVPSIARTVTSASDGIVNGIARVAAGHKVVVMGASFQRSEKDQTSTKPVFQQIHERTGLPIAMVRGSQQESLAFHAPSFLFTSKEPFSQRVDRWFAENTFHSSEFSDLNILLAMKEKQGVTISIALPALNEEKTVGKVIDTLQKALMKDVPLVDEIVLIDSNSTDDTVAIAQAAGLPVYKHPEILADEVGTLRGKGEALWKSLYETKGDIIAWVDTDITNIHPRFIYGLLGPLLQHRRIQYVKGFYARPIRVGDKIQPYGGGRVTELVARPMLNLFFPELSGIIQPLSGEYAGRRAALEQIPFFSGYGVETGLLIDLHEIYGLEGIAQSDLEVRVHHNQPLVNLSKMSFAIHQVFIARIEKMYGVKLLEKANHTMKLITQEDEHFTLDIAEIEDVERPSMLSLAQYRQKFNREVQPENA